MIEFVVNCAKLIHAKTVSEGSCGVELDRVVLFGVVDLFGVVCLVVVVVVVFVCLDGRREGGAISGGLFGVMEVARGLEREFTFSDCLRAVFAPVVVVLVVVVDGLVLAAFTDCLRNDCPDCCFVDGASDGGAG